MSAPLGEARPSWKIQASEIDRLLGLRGRETFSLDSATMTGDVVVSSAFPGRFRQGFAGEDGLCFATHDFTDTFVVDQPAQAIAAHHDDVVLTRIHVGQVHGHVFGRTERLKNDIRVFEELRPLRA